MDAKSGVSLPFVVLDTNVALALFAWADPSCSALAKALHERRLQAVANAATRGEWLRVLWRRTLPLEHAIRLQAERLFDTLVIEKADEASADRSEIVLPRCRDPDDQIFLKLAQEARCSVLYSRDRELLKLTRRTWRDAAFIVVRPEAYDPREHGTQSPAQDGLLPA